MKGTSGLKVTERTARRQEGAHRTWQKGPSVRRQAEERNGGKPDCSKPGNTHQPKNAVNSKQSRHEGTDVHPPRQHRCSEPSQKHCPQTQQDPARGMQKSLSKEVSSSRGRERALRGGTRLHRGLCNRAEAAGEGA